MCGERIKKEQSRSDKKLEKIEKRRKVGKMTKVRGKKEEKINFWLILLLYYYYVTSYKIILL